MKHAKKGLERINRHKMLKRVEIFNKIERIKSEKENTDTEAIEQKFTTTTENCTRTTDL